MLTEDQKAALIKRHATTYRNRHVDTKALGFTEADLNALIADVEQAVRKEMEGDAKDAKRYRWLRDESVPPHNFYLSVPIEFDGVRYGPHEVDAYIDAAKG